MAYQEWVELFGHNSEDELLCSKLISKGIVPQSLEVEKDDISVYEDVSGEGIVLVFTDEAYLYKRTDMALGEGAPVLSQLILGLQKTEDGPAYSGPLPFELQRDHSRMVLRKRFGAPSKNDDDPPWDQWSVDRLVLTVEYSEDEQRLTLVSLEMSV